MEQPISKNNITPLNVLFFIFTAVFQGVFNILLLNTASDWYNNIRAYYFKATLITNLLHDTDIYITYKNSKYDKISGDWLLPVLTVKPDITLIIDYVINPCDFKNQYFNYVKRVASVSIVLIVVLAIILSSAIVRSNIVAIISVSVLILGAMLLAVMITISQYKKLKKLYKSFLKKN